MRRFVSDQKGFTLVEVIISIAILSMASVVVLQLFMTSVELNTKSRHSDIASVLTTNYIEMIKLHDDLDTLTHDVDSLNVATGGYEASTFLTDNFEVSPDNSPQGSSYHFTCVMTPGSMDGLYDIEVSMTDLASQKALVTYTTTHYFKGEVAVSE